MKDIELEDIKRNLRYDPASKPLACHLAKRLLCLAEKSSFLQAGEILFLSNEALSKYGSDDEIKNTLSTVIEKCQKILDSYPESFPELDEFRNFFINLGWKRKVFLGFYKGNCIVGYDGSFKFYNSDGIFIDYHFPEKFKIRQKRFLREPTWAEKYDHETFSTRDYSEHEDTDWDEYVHQKWLLM